MALPTLRPHRNSGTVRASTRPTDLLGSGSGEDSDVGPGKDPAGPSAALRRNAASGWWGVRPRHWRSIRRPWLKPPCGVTGHVGSVPGLAPSRGRCGHSGRFHHGRVQRPGPRRLGVGGAAGAGTAPGWRAFDQRPRPAVPCPGPATPAPARPARRHAICAAARQRPRHTRCMTREIVPG